MIVAIDGTGPDSPSDYAKEMGGSFCSQIGRTANAIYLRGPTLTGSETSAIAKAAVDAVMARRNKPSTGEVMLAGYSRGGCAAIIAARRLKDRGIGVHSLFLFDAVDMQTSEMHLSQIISDNVRMVAHVRSARNLSFWIRNPENRDSISAIPAVISPGQEATKPNRSLAATARWAAFLGRTSRKTSVVS
jgi:thioesterase domain-containing protein